MKKAGPGLEIARPGPAFSRCTCREEKDKSRPCGTKWIQGRQKKEKTIEIKDKNECNNNNTMFVYQAVKRIDKCVKTAKIVILNDSATAFDDRADLIIRGKLGEIFINRWPIGRGAAP